MALRPIKKSDLATWGIPASIYALVVELVDTLDLGSNERSCGFESHRVYQPQ